MTLDLHLWYVPLLCFAGFALNIIFGRFWSHAVAGVVGVGFSALAFADAVWVALRWLGTQTPYLEQHGNWISAAGLTVPFGFQLDQLSLVMLLVVTGVGFLIHIYSAGYMAHEGGFYRYFALLNLFLFFMMVLVLSSNYALMFIGWEGVGFVSYMLIGFFFRRDSAAKAGLKAFVVNRIGDFGFLIALFLLFQRFHSFDFTSIFAQARTLPVETSGAGILTAICLLLFVGATGKSAQIPLYVWLPDAMEGPTPVSALIHAATMVTAGVYMVARSATLYVRAPQASAVVLGIGGATALFAAIIGLLQRDIKRVLAYSTVSQLGYMFMACGVLSYGAGIFHLMTHAFFKGLLFLSAGSVIHAAHGEQDMFEIRKLSPGGLRKYAPVTFWCFAAATCAISGIPGFSGFFSKDQILSAVFNVNKFWWAIGTLTALLTSFYMFRALFITFFANPEGTAEPSPSHAHPSGQEPSEVADHNTLPHESPAVMTVPLIILALLSTFGGLVGLGDRFTKFLSPAFQTGLPPATGPAGSDTTVFAASITVALLGLLLAWWFYLKNPAAPRRLAASFPALRALVFNKFWIDELYGAVIITPLTVVSRVLLDRGVEQTIVDGGVQGTAWLASATGNTTRRQASGNLRSYAAWLGTAAVAVLFYVLVVGFRRF